MAYAELYLAKDKEPNVIEQQGRPTQGSPMGEAMLSRIRLAEQKALEAEKEQARKELKLDNDLKKEQLRKIELDKKTQQTEDTPK